MKQKRQTKKELQEYIEMLEEAIQDGDHAYQEKIGAQNEYKKRFGKEYEW
jgi:hypothetical protein